MDIAGSPDRVRVSVAGFGLRKYSERTLETPESYCSSYLAMSDSRMCTGSHRLFRDIVFVVKTLGLIKSFLAKSLGM